MKNTTIGSHPREQDSARTASFFKSKSIFTQRMGASVWVGFKTTLGASSIRFVFENCYLVGTTSCMRDLRALHWRYIVSSRRHDHSGIDPAKPVSQYPPRDACNAL